MSHLLIVDDHPVVRRMMAASLSQAGHEATTVCNGQEALDFLRGGSPAPDLILLDLLMPGMDGESFLWNRQRDSDLAAIPVVVCSGDAEMEGRELAATYGAGFCRKPFEAGELLRVTARQLARATLRG